MASPGSKAAWGTTAGTLSPTAGCEGLDAAVKATTTSLSQLQHLQDEVSILLAPLFFNCIKKKKENYKGTRGGIGPNKEPQNVTGTVTIAEQILTSRRSNKKAGIYSQKLSLQEVMGN